MESRGTGEITSGQAFPKLQGGRYVRFLLQPSHSSEWGGVAIFQNSMTGRFFLKPRTCLLVGLLRTELGEFPRVPGVLSSVQL